MAYVINDSCISCGACADQCPVSAISEGDTQYNIDEVQFCRPNCKLSQFIFLAKSFLQGWN